MLVYECDRCGKVWKRREPNAIESLGDTLIQAFSQFAPNPRKEAMVNEMLDDLAYHSHHLCNDCKTSFKNWFMGGKSDEKTT